MKAILDTLGRIGDAAGEVRGKIEGAELRDGDRDAALGDADKIAGAAEKLRDFVTGLERDQSAESTERADLRHKLRTPINHMLGYCELMLEEAEEFDGSDWDGELVSIQAMSKALIREVDELLARVSPTADSENSQRTASFRFRDGARTASLLVVDDNAENRDMLTRRLRGGGAFVLEAADGKEALHLAKNVSIDLMLLDIMMPVMDGYETLGAFKSDPELRAVPIIMLSSLDEPEAITRCIELGAEDHLPKPFDPVLLHARIGACLEKKRLHDREQSHKRQIILEKERADSLLNVVIPLGVALSQETRLDSMLERIVSETQALCRAEGGALFLGRDDGALHPVIVRCPCIDLLAVEGDMHESHIDLESEDIAAEAVRRGGGICVPDASAEPSPRVAWMREFDRRNGHRTHGLMAVPLADPGDTVVGALVLWNARDRDNGEQIGFDANLRQLVESLSALAGLALARHSRESALRERIAALEIQVDERKREQQVAEITETDYFRSLRSRARKLRNRDD